MPEKSESGGDVTQRRELGSCSDERAIGSEICAGMIEKRSAATDTVKNGVKLGRGRILHELFVKGLCSIVQDLHDPLVNDKKK